MSCSPLCVEIMIEIAIAVITLGYGMRATNTTMGMVLMKEHETHKIYKETTDRNGKEKMFMMMSPMTYLRAHAQAHTKWGVVVPENKW